MSQLGTWALEYGLWGLGGLAFLAATILPFSSEAAITAALLSNLDPTSCVIAASIGNCLACLLNYGIGLWTRDKAQAKLEASPTGRRALDWLDRYGPWSLAASVFPVIGDPITIAAGIARVPLWLFLTVVWTLRIGRYILIAATVSSATS